ncbi:unnamed protein product [Durusdinium trenchii]
MSGGEIRLVITLCASDDLQGEAFGAKVTPWLKVPTDEAPQWKAREALFAVPMERCFEATFVDSAHLQIALMQKGHASPQERPNKSMAQQVGSLGFSALQGGLSALRVESFPLGSAVNLGFERQSQGGEMIGILKIPVGRRLACGQGGNDGAQWVQLQKNETVKGSLLLELATDEHLEAMAAAVISPVVPTASFAPAVYSAPAAPLGPTSPSHRDAIHSPERSGSEIRESSPITSSQSGQGSRSACQSDSESGTRDGLGEHSDGPEFEAGSVRSAEEEAFLKSLSAESNKVLLEMSQAKPSAPREWRPRASPTTQSEDNVNIFNINESGRGSSVGRWLKWSTAPVRLSSLRSALDPGVRQQRKEVRKWRQWHEVFCVLNAIEHHLSEIMSGLRQAEASMRRFGQSHGSEALREPSRLPAFLCDAALYYQSEAAVPAHLEDQLSQLEALADEFRGISLEPDVNTPRPESEDLRVDIAVLLESLIMGSYQALAEYKKMHCRLELVAKEYEPLCRLEVDNASKTFLPLLVDVPVPAVLPEQAVQWAEDFSQLVGNASVMLTALVRELQSRKGHLGSSLSELRSLLLRHAAGD